MIRILGTIFAGLFGLAFGSFLNVCLSRWPVGESIVRPRSHCRDCDHTLAWFENIPLVSYLRLRGRCRVCFALIGWRYPAVELTIGALWALIAFKSLPAIADPSLPIQAAFAVLLGGVAKMILCWFLVALAALDAERLWLPDFLTLPGAALGLGVTSALEVFSPHFDAAHRPIHVLLLHLGAMAVFAGLLLLTRWIYKLIRHREGLGLGDAKLMLLLGAWLGPAGTLAAFAVGTFLGVVAAAVLLVFPAARRDSSRWATSKLPLGTFLSIGGIISSLWGQSIIAAYLRWAGL